MDQILLAKYAEFAVEVAVNVQPGQNFIINCPIEAAALAHLCVKAGYEAGAREVVVRYTDEQLSRLTMQNAATEVLEDVKPWKLASLMEYYTHEGSLCVLNIRGENPQLYKGIEPEKISRAMHAAGTAMQPFRVISMGNRIQWSIIAYPGQGWAQQVFPDVPLEQAVEQLWQAIFTACRVIGGNPVAEWQAHADNLKARRNWIQALQLESLHFTSANGTDLVVGLADEATWGGGEEFSTSGVRFLPNIPTEEVFTAPHRAKVNGVVKSSLPYVYNGTLIEGITVRFENGKAVEYAAQSGDDILHQMLSADAGALHLGEIALVPASSPIRQSGILFYNTLFDENAACHMAFGAGYPGTVKNGDNLPSAQLLAMGVNESIIHEDIMIGTPDMQVTGLCKNGETVQIFVNGEWA